MELQNLIHIIFSILIYSYLIIFVVEGASVPSTTTKKTTTSASPGRPGCGGTVTGSGEIRYKVGEQYEKNEQCVWTIINEKYPLITLDLTDAGFAEEGDHLEIFYYKDGQLMNPVTGSGPHCDGPILSRRTQFCMVNSSLVFLVFRTNQALQGTGFAVKIEPSGSMLPPSGEIFEPYTYSRDGSWVDYDGAFVSKKIVSWTLVAPTEFVLYRYNVTSPCPPSNTLTPIISIFQANRGSPTRMEYACGTTTEPIRVIQPPIGAEPFVIIYENGQRTYSRGEIKFYWNLDGPPESWKPGKGRAGILMVSGVSSFWTGLLFIVVTIFVG